MSRFSKWCFTENNEPDTFRINLPTLFENQKNIIKYICGQLEVASTGQMHFQGYVQLKVTQRLSWLRNNISATAHFEAQKARSNAAARDYTMKEDETTVADTFIELGKFAKGPGERTDLKPFKDAIIAGSTQRELLEDYLMEIAKFPKLYNTIRALNKPVREGEFRVVLYYGEPGTGKTRKVWEDHPDHWAVPIGDKIWFDGYDMHKVVLFDDFAGAASKVSLNDTLRMLDRYPVQAPVKGSYTWYMPEIIYITTNLHPRGWYKWLGREVHWRALKRRIHQVFVFENDDFDEYITVEDFMEDRDLWPQIDVNGINQ